MYLYYRRAGTDDRNVVLGQGQIPTDEQGANILQRARFHHGIAAELAVIGR